MELTVPIAVKWDDIEEDLAKKNIVKVVRCKDCKHWWKEHKICTILTNDNVCRVDMEADDYCSKGEKKKGR